MTDVLRVLQFSDTHLFADRTDRFRDVCTFDSFATVLDDARSGRLSATDALLLTGDVVNDEPGGYAHALSLLQPLGKPVYGIPGNHDRREPMQAAFDHARFQLCGYVDLAHWRLVLLDSVVPDAAHGELSQRELQRLDAALATAGTRHVLIALHHHPVSLASAWLDQVGLGNADAFFAITDRYANVRAICWGHVHQEFEALRRGVRLMSAPSTCVQFQPRADDFAIEQAPPGYRQLTLHARGTIETEVIRVEVE